jgi:hypothetical protein
MKTFSKEQIREWVNRVTAHSGDHQDILIVLFAYYGLSRSTETKKITEDKVTFVSEKENEIMMTVDRTKTGAQSRVTVYGTTVFNVATMYKLHLLLTPADDRMWWRWDEKKSKFQNRPIGKNYLGKLAKRIADFYSLDPRFFFLFFSLFFLFIYLFFQGLCCTQFSKNWCQYYGRKWCQ